MNKRLILFIVVIGATIFFTYFFSCSFIRDLCRPGIPRDARRLADAKQIENTLTLYYNSNSSTYPIFKASNQEEWTAFSRILILNNNKITKIPEDPSYYTKNQRSYFYGSDEIGSNYVLGALLDNDKGKFERFLKEDIDGLAFGIDCNDPVYCIGPVESNQP